MCTWPRSWRDVYAFSENFLVQLPDWVLEGHWDAIRAKFDSPDYRTRWAAIKGILTGARIEQHLMDLTSILRETTSENTIEIVSACLLTFPEPKLSAVVSFILDSPNDTELFRGSFYLLCSLPARTIKTIEDRLCLR